MLFYRSLIYNWTRPQPNIHLKMQIIGSRKCFNHFNCQEKCIKFHLENMKIDYL